MKVVLVVASGVHTGKEIAFPGKQFVIGRDENCHLRPASPAISKKHCVFEVRDDQIFLRDLGSTNGTLVNNEPLTGEVQLQLSDRIKVGPLDFTLKIIRSDKKSDATPLPASLRQATASKKSSTAMPKATGAKPSSPAQPPLKSAAQAKKDHADDIADDIAAMLLGMDDDDPESKPEVPEGSTVMDMPAVNTDGTPKKEAEKKKQVPEQADSSQLARDLLSKMTRRPR